MARPRTLDKGQLAFESAVNMSSFAKLGSGAGAGGYGTVSKGAANIGPPLRLQSPRRAHVKHACLPPKFHSPQRRRFSFHLQGGSWCIECKRSGHTKADHCPNDGPTFVGKSVGRCRLSTCRKYHYCSCTHGNEGGVYMHGSAAGWASWDCFSFMKNGKRKLTCGGNAAQAEVHGNASCRSKTLAKLTAAAAANPELIDLVCSVADRELMVGDIFDVLRLLPADSTLMFTARRRVPIDATWDEAEGLMWLEQLLAFQYRSGGSNNNSNCSSGRDVEEDEGAF